MFRRRWTRHPSHRASRSPRFEVRSYSLAYAYNQNLNDQEENATYPSPPHAMLAMSIMFIYFMPLSYALCIFSFNYLSAGFLSLPLHVRMWSEDAWSQGKVSQVQAKMARMRGCGCGLSGCNQQVQGLSFSLLVMYSFRPPSSSSLSPLDGLYQVYYALYHSSSSLKYEDPLFTFQQLYFGPCSRGVGIYFLALCASIVHDAYIYIYIYT